jgi:hypothetical protein
MCRCPGPKCGRAIAYSKRRKTIKCLCTFKFWCSVLAAQDEVSCLNWVSIILVAASRARRKRTHLPAAMRSGGLPWLSHIGLQANAWRARDKGSQNLDAKYLMVRCASFLLMALFYLLNVVRYCCLAPA